MKKKKFVNTHYRPIENIILWMGMFCYHHWFIRKSDRQKSARIAPADAMKFRLPISFGSSSVLSRNCSGVPKIAASDNVRNKRLSFCVTRRVGKKNPRSITSENRLNGFRTYDERSSLKGVVRVRNDHFISEAIDIRLEWDKGTRSSYLSNNKFDITYILFHFFLCSN